MMREVSHVGIACSAETKLSSHKNMVRGYLAGKELVILLVMMFKK